MVLQKLKADAEKYVGEPVTAGCHHRSGLLQRRTASGNQGRWQDRRPRGQAYHQRAYRSSAGLRPRQEGRRREDPRLRPRRRHLRRFHPRDGRWRLRGCSRPQATTTWVAMTGISASSIGWPTSSRPISGIDLRKDKMALQRLKEAAEKAKMELSDTHAGQLSTCRSSRLSMAARSTWTTR